MISSIHWGMLIEDGFLPTIPRWRTLIATLRFWQCLTEKTLCPHARKASARWQALSAKQRVRIFWKKIERYPTAETAIALVVLTTSTLSRFVCCGKEVKVRLRLNALLPCSTLVELRFLQSHGAAGGPKGEPCTDEATYSFTSISSLRPASALTAQSKSNRLTKS